MRYAMQSWEGDDGDEFPDGNGGHWENMHDDDRPAVAKHWRPRASALEAAIHCLAWTGFVGIPAMQVVDLSTGDVVWRHSHAYPGAGESIELPDEHLVRAGARAVWAGKPPVEQRQDDTLF